jgi:hypothetical protein
VSETIEKNLLSAIRELSTLTKEEYSLVEAAFGKIVAARVGEFVVAPVWSNSRPTTHSIIAIDSSGKAYLPSIRDDDFEIIKNIVVSRLRNLCKGISEYSR